MKPFIRRPTSVIRSVNREIHCFEGGAEGGNIDVNVVASFGWEWGKFHEFGDAEIERLARGYFDIVDERMVNKNSYGIDIGCGTGRWTKYMLDKIGFMEAMDPSDAIYSADKLLGRKENVRLSKASVDNIPFENETFDFGMSVGVLHHIPDPQKAMVDCVRKIKIGGYFYTYLYYSLDNRGVFFRALLFLVTVVRTIVSSLPPGLKGLVCDVLALTLYMPLVLLARGLRLAGLGSLSGKLPLAGYMDQTFFVMRNDALDRFGTSLEKRFSRVEVEQMMSAAGLGKIVIADTPPYWHAVGERVR